MAVAIAVFFRPLSDYAYRETSHSKFKFLRWEKSTWRKISFAIALCWTAAALILLFLGLKAEGRL